MTQDKSYAFGPASAPPILPVGNFSALKGNGRSSEVQYERIPHDVIQALPVAAMAQPDCMLFLSVTDPHLQRGFQIIDARGFKYACADGLYRAQHVGGETRKMSGALRSPLSPRVGST